MDLTPPYKEWEVHTPQSDRRLAGRSLDNRFQSVAKRLSGSEILKVTELKDGLSIETFSYVGKVSFGDLDITINPKITFLPLMDLMRYAFDFRSISLFSEAKFETESMFQGLLIWQLIVETKEILLRGLKKSYLGKREFLSSPKGRIDFNTLARDGGLKGGSIYCCHFPRLEDNLINRVLLSGLWFAERTSTDSLLRIELQSLISIVQPFVSTVPLTHEALRSATDQMNRLSRAYEPAVCIIKILFEGSGLSLEGEGKIILSGFLFDMNTFFQAFVSKFLRENLDGLKVEDDRGIRGMVEYIPDYNPLNKRPPAPRPDFTIFDGKRMVAILDARYRDLWKNDLPRDMLYQLCIYALSQKENPESIILYPCTSREAKEQVIQVFDPIKRTGMAKVILRPIKILDLRELINQKGSQAERRRREIAHDLIKKYQLKHKV